MGLFCRYYWLKPCSRDWRCDVFSCVSGNVGCCVLHPNPVGRFMPKSPSVQTYYIFSKHHRF